jgi:formylglycine-generating enzyme required for sulfatase activity
MAGNVWEWVSDWYSYNYYSTVKDGVTNPQGPIASHDPDEPNVPKKSLRGGSFLCNESYCSGYRVAARMKTSPDTSMEHLGFRCVSSS